ncbi:MAG: hypothetical protein P8N28_03090 [Phycisphaerales bacterium]|nr:hypothetical protein [Phycisphaerales bacterium]
MKTATALPAISGGAQAITLNHEEAIRWPIILNDDDQAVLTVLHDSCRIRR